VDLSRTVGWFTSIFPVLLKLEDRFDTGEVLKSVKEQLRSIPNRGIDYGIWRYLRLDESDRSEKAGGRGQGAGEQGSRGAGEQGSRGAGSRGEKLPIPVLPRAEVSFNYLGQFDQTQLATLGWKYAQESCGSIHSPKGQRRHLLTVNGLVVEGRLKLEWQYSEHFHSRATVENLANEYIETLETIIAHCLSPEAGGYTPSDFPEVEFSQEALDELLAEIN
jgi:non-ribosomal peptide synthase protein (TIGR01720 family)